MHTHHPDTPRSLFIEVFKTRSELYKILWITAIWVLISISQTVYDHILLLSAGMQGSADDFWTGMLVNIIATALAGMVGGAILVAYLQRWIRNNPYGHAIGFILVAYTMIICLVTIFAFLTRSSLEGEPPLQNEGFFSAFGQHIRSLRFAKDYFLWLFVVLCTIAGLLINDKYGPGNLSSFFKGRYFRPKREEHIFMFLDLRGSTYIAQILGESRYFHFIKDVIRDVTPVILRHQGKIYQYVGDEITVSWWMHTGLQKLNCVRCFFEVRKIFDQRSAYYKTTYGVVPDFKAGLHCGPVMVGEIGVVKRDIAFSGEVVGTAARIQNRCNHLEVNILLSKDLKDLLPWDDSMLRAEHKGDLLIKGRTENLALYTVLTR